MSTALPVQEQTELLEEQRPGGLLFEHQVIRARQRDVPRTRDLGRQQRDPSPAALRDRDRNG